MANTPLTRELFLRSFLGGPASATPTMLDGLTRVIEERAIKSGDTLFREGDPADRLYFFENGRIQMSREGHKPYVYVGHWVVGAIDLLAGRPRRRTATSLLDAEVVSVRREDWFDFVEDALEFARDIINNQMSAAARDYARLAPDPFPPPLPSPPLPDSRLSLFDRILAFFDSPVLRRAGVQPLAIMAEACQEIRLSAGQELIAEGALREHLYLVAYGGVETTHTAPVAMTGRFGRSTFVGGTTALSTDWSARATEPSAILALPLEDWFDALSHFDLVVSTMASIALERERVNETVADRMDTEMVLE